MQQQIQTASQAESTSGLPCADPALLVPLKRSAAYGAIRRQVADPRPVDSWLESHLHYFVFRLNETATMSAVAAASSPPVAVFTMNPFVIDPVAAVAVTPLPAEQQAEVVDLKGQAAPYRVPLDSLSNLIDG